MSDVFEIIDKYDNFVKKVAEELNKLNTELKKIADEYEKEAGYNDENPGKSKE